MTSTTKHTCGGVSFGRKTAGCPRCDELLAGAPSRSWGREARKCISCGRAQERGVYGVCSSCSLKAHDCKRSGCSVICTFGDW